MSATTETHETPALDAEVFETLKKRVCQPEFWQDSPVLRPFLIRIGPEPWTAFTDGHVLVAARGTRDGVEPYAGRHAERLPGVLLNLDRHYAPSGQSITARVDFCALTRWVDVSAVGKCPLCRGTGRDADDLSDEEVNERINGGPEPRYGRVGGLLVNREVIAPALASLRAGEVEIVVRAKGEPALIDAGDWRMLVMPVIDKGEDVPSLPAEFETLRPRAV